MRRQFFSTSKIAEEDDKNAITCESTLRSFWKRRKKNWNQVHPAKITHGGTTSKAGDKSFVGLFFCILKKSIICWYLDGPCKAHQCHRYFRFMEDALWVCVCARERKCLQSSPPSWCHLNMLISFAFSQNNKFTLHAKVRYGSPRFAQ